MIGFIKRRPVISIVIVLASFAILHLFGILSNLRYEFEKRFGNPHTFFYGVNFAEYNPEINYYEHEYDLDESNKKYVRDTLMSDDYYIYGKYVNSADPLVVVVNDIVVYAGKAHREGYDVFGKYYIERNFVVKLANINESGTNTIILSTGNANETYTIVFR